jgi:DNA invertase Pin-like site-specific DNA recombinase
MLLAYAYMRVPSTIADEKVRRKELRLRACAEELGLHLAGIFREDVGGAHGEFDDMLAELQRNDAHYVLIPTFGHLSSHLLLQNTFLFRLEVDADAEVFALAESA